MDREFLNIQEQILKNWKVNDEFITKVKSISDDILKDAENELDIRKNVLKNLDNFLEKMQRTGTLSDEIIKELKNVEKSSEIINNIIEQSESYIESFVDRIPFLSKEMKDSLGNQIKNLAAPLIDKFAQVKDSAIESFNKIGIVGKLSFAGIGAALFVAFNIFKKWDESIENMIKNLGATRDEIENIKNESQKVWMSTAKYGIEMGQVLDTAVALTEQFGSMKDIEGLIKPTSMIAQSFGMSAESAASLVKLQTQSLKLSKETLESNMKLIKGLAKEYGIGPGKIAQDLVDASEQVAAFSKGTGENMIKAAVFARKLGVSLSDVSNIAESLLDIESSTQAALEAQMLFGNSINVTEARRKAMMGDVQGAATDILKQYSETADLSNLNYWQVKNMAKMLGVSADKARQMVSQFQESEKNLSNMDSLTSNINKIMEKQSFEDALKLDKTMSQLKQIWGLLKYSFLPVLKPILSIVESVFWVIEKILKGIVLLQNSVKDLFGKFEKIGSTASTIVTLGFIPMVFYSGKLIKNLGIIKGLFGTLFSASKKLMSSLTAGATDKISSGMGGLMSKISPKKANIVDNKSSGKLFSSLSKINPKQLLAGGAAMIMVASAVFVLSKSMQEFAKVDWKKINGWGIVGIVALTSAMMGLGALMASGVGTVALIAGAAGMVIMSSAIFVLGKAMQEFAKAAVISIPFFELLNTLDAKNISSVGLSMIGLGAGLSALAAGNILNSLVTLFTGNSFFEQLQLLSQAAPQLLTVSNSLENIAKISQDFELSTIKTELESLVEPLKNVSTEAEKAKSEMLKLNASMAISTIASAVKSTASSIFKNNQSPVIVQPSDVVLDGKKLGTIIFKVQQGEF